MISYILMERFCRYCVKDLPIDNFEEGLKTCKKCLEYKRANVINIDKVNEAQRKRYEEDEEYRKKKLEQNHKFNLKTITCSVCNCSIRQQCYSRHLKTNKHQINLGNGQ